MSEVIEVYSSPSVIEVVSQPIVNVIEVIETGPRGPAGQSIEAYSFGKTITGVYVGTFLLGFNGSYTFESFDAWVNAPITGSALVLDILKGDAESSLWASAPSNRPTIAVGQRHAVTGGAPSVSAFINGDYVKYSVASYGSNATLDLQGVLRVRRTG